MSHSDTWREIHSLATHHGLICKDEPNKVSVASSYQPPSLPWLSDMFPVTYLPKWQGFGPLPPSYLYSHTTTLETTSRDELTEIRHYFHLERKQDLKEHWLTQATRHVDAFIPVPSSWKTA